MARIYPSPLGRLFILAASAAFGIVAAAQSPTASQPSPSASQAPPSPASPLQVKTRLVTVDVVATNSHGAAVRDLKPEDFEISDSGRQKIEKFAFIDKSPSFAPGAHVAQQALPKDVFTNQAALTNLAMPPTIVLMDSLNTETENLMQTRRNMLKLLGTIPQDTPVAVFLLTQSLRVVQDFTSDPARLRDAVNKAMSPSPPLDPMPEDDPNSMSLAAFDANGGQENDQTELLEDFEKDNYANTMDIRVRTTIDALTTIAHYLSGYQGRKNLIWVSASFPAVLWPDMDFGTNTGVFRASRDYGDQVQQAANALDDANVAVYPVDARGLETSQVFSAATQTTARPNSAARTMSRQIQRENTLRTDTQNTMDKLAEDSGGKTCKNTNDLSGCVEAALRDSSSYYELAYYPQDIRWDGSFHKISVKTTRSGVNLAYRRGYFASDEQTLATKQTPDQRLQKSCQDYLPSTAIPMRADLVAADRSDQIRYLVTVPASVLTITPDGTSYKLSAEMAACVFDEKAAKFQFEPHDLSRTLSGSAFANWQANGWRGFVDVPKDTTGRVRIELLDLGSGLTGSLDIIPPKETPNSAGTKIAANSQQPENSGGYTIGFSIPSGKSGSLEWSGDALVYKGDLDIKQTAPAFFSKFYFTQGFHCEAGKLIPNVANSTEEPQLHLAFQNRAGQTAKVDLTGAQPEYSGSLPVDDSAKLFFTRVWYLAHCTSPPPN
jgi:VWFA-related protein